MDFDVDALGPENMFLLSNSRLHGLSMIGIYHGEMVVRLLMVYAL